MSFPSPARRSQACLPADAHSGKYAFWSNKGDSSDMTLTRSFDFTEVNGPIEFSYWTWYDIEKGYDYVYLEASTDGQAVDNSRHAVLHQQRYLWQFLRLRLHRQERRRPDVTMDQ